MNTDDPIFEKEEDVVQEDGKRFPDRERPKLPWDEKPKTKSKTTWERFGDVDAFRRKIMICGAVVGVIAAFIIEIIWLPGSLFIRYESRNVRGSWLELFSYLEIAGGLLGAGIGWVIARLIIGY